MNRFDFSLPLTAGLPKGLLGLYFLPARMVLKAQYSMINTLTLGLLDDFSEEVEHALVEGVDVVRLLADKIVEIQQTPLTIEQRQLLARTSLEDAETTIRHILDDLFRNVLALPFNRIDDRPSRKRFPVVIEGSVQHD